MGRRRGYPEEGGDERGRVRRRQFGEEAGTLGDPRRRLTGGPEEKNPESGRVMHGRLIQPGIRPLMKVRKTSRFMGSMTDRQRRRGKVRTARSWGRTLAMLEKNDMTMEEFCETLSPEELVYGKLKDKNGTFSGRPPAWVPREFHRACIRELMRRGQHLWRENYLASIEAMTMLAQDPKVKPADRIKAAIFVIERIEGKIPERVEITGDSPWQLAIEDIVAEVPDSSLLRARAARMDALTAQDEQEILDAELVEEVPKAPVRRRAASRRSSRG